MKLRAARPSSPKEEAAPRRAGQAAAAAPPSPANREGREKGARGSQREGLPRADPCALPRGDSPQIAAGRVLVVVLRLRVPKQHLGDSGEGGSPARSLGAGTRSVPAGLPTPRLTTYCYHHLSPAPVAAPKAPGAFMAQPRRARVGCAAEHRDLPRPAPHSRAAAAGRRWFRADGAVLPALGRLLCKRWFVATGGKR